MAQSNTQSVCLWGGCLVTTSSAGGVVDPVKDDERQATDHEDDAHHQENECLQKQRRLNMSAHRLTL